MVQSYKTESYMDHCGEWNVPIQYLKKAKWESHKLPDGTIDTGYYTQDPHGDSWAVDFNFNTLTWGTIDFPANSQHQLKLTTPAPITLSLHIFDEERTHT